MIGSLVALAIAAAPMHAFRIGADWLVVDDSGSFVSRHTPITDETIFDGDIAPDGSFFVFSILNPAGAGHLARWQVGEAKLQMFVEERGFYGAPRFSRDGAWLFVAHYPFAGGAPGNHAPMEYAQLYRINVHSRQMQKLTNSTGCHMSSFSNDGDRVVFGHSTCKGKKHIEALTTPGSLAAVAFPQERTLADEGGLLDEPTLSGDGSVLVYTRRNGNQVQLVAESRKKARVLFAGTDVGLFRPAVTSRNTVLFQHGRSVLAVSLSAEKPFTVIFEG